MLDDVIRDFWGFSPCVKLGPLLSIVPAPSAPFFRVSTSTIGEQVLRISVHETARSIHIRTQASGVRKMMNCIPLVVQESSANI